MRMEIYQENIKKIKKKFPNWADTIEQKRYPINKLIQVDTDRAIDGETIFRVSFKGKIGYLNGKYNPSYAAKDWLDKIGKIDDFATIIIVGIHDAKHIQNILEKLKPENNVLIYEPSIEVFLKALQEIDLTFLFEENIPVGIVVDGINEQELEVYFNKMIPYDNMTMLKIYISGNYEKIFEEKVSKFVKMIKRHILDLRKNWNTVVRYTNVNAINTFTNLKYMYDGYSIASLRNMLPVDIPTIVVSAGPSLNKNINDLKLAVGKANIVATDTAMKPLLNAGIIPNFFVVVDGLKPGDLFKHKDISKVPMVTMNAISIEPMKIHKGKKFFYYSGSAIETEIIERAQKKEKETYGISYLASGGSVATSAYSLGIFMGSRTIILVGQDLAMTGNRTHADGTFKEKMDEIDVKSGEYFEVEAIDGGKVLTRIDFKMYLDWFEKQIREQCGIRVIDATEGGAKIHGSEIMSLKEAIEKTCKREFNVRYRVSRCPQMLGPKGKEELLKFFEEAPRKLFEVKKKAIEGEHQYERLEKLAHKKQYTEMELSKIVNRIGKINKYMETDYMACVVNDSIKGVEMTIRESIYQTKDNEKDEMLDIAQNGKLMMGVTKYAAEELITISENTIKKFALKKQKRNGQKAGK